MLKRVVMKGEGMWVGLGVKVCSAGGGDGRGGEEAVPLLHHLLLCQTAQRFLGTSEGRIAVLLFLMCMFMCMFMFMFMFMSMFMFMFMFFLMFMFVFMLFMFMFVFLFTLCLR